MRQVRLKVVTGIIIFLFFIGGAVCGAAQSPLDAFPPAGENEARHVIELKEKGKSDEMNYKIELIPGKVVTTDGVNVVRLGLYLEPVNLKGWGYTYYKVSGKDQVLSTMMAVPEGTETVDKFVPGNSLMVRYNSRLPIVVYSPQGIDIHYKLWVAGEELKAEKDM